MLKIEARAPQSTTDQPNLKLVVLIASARDLDGPDFLSNLDEQFHVQIAGGTADVRLSSHRFLLSALGKNLSKPFRLP
jgi:hypothetical protein